MRIGYCGNVHSGTSLEEVKSNMARYSLEVKRLARPDRDLDVGLWLSATTTRELTDQTTLLGFRDWLAERGLVPYTINGFPYGDFHQAVVKHGVYEPTWASQERLDYTIGLAQTLNILLPPGERGSISTLPLGWPVNMTTGASRVEDKGFWEASAKNLRKLSDHLDDLLQSTGREIIVCLEPEPGCLFDTATDITQFFAEHLRTGESLVDQRIERHLGVCHDVCHSAVMFEPQETAIRAYADHGVRVGKVQVSSAVVADFDAAATERGQQWSELQQFVEPRYLHQTSVRAAGETRFFEDLSLAMASLGGGLGDDAVVGDGISAAQGIPGGEWRVHFHVPIFASKLKSLATTQAEIGQCFSAVMDAAARLDTPLPHFEVETYAWTVLPSGLHNGTLAAGIARELDWFGDLVEGKVEI